MSDVRPGDVHVFKKGEGKAVAATFGLWAEQRNEWIEIHLAGCGGNTTVNNQPKSQRYHRTLFRNLRRLIVEHGVW